MAQFATTVVLIITMISWGIMVSCEEGKTDAPPELQKASAASNVESPSSLFSVGLHPLEKRWINVPMSKFERLRFWANWNMDEEGVSVKKAGLMNMPEGKLYFVQLTYYGKYKCHSVFYVLNALKEKRLRNPAIAYCILK